MEPYFYTRIAMGGWATIATVIATSFACKSLTLDKLAKFASDGSATALVAILSAAIGIGAPPLLGMIYQRFISNVLWLFGRNMWLYPEVLSFGKAVSSRKKCDPAPDPSAVFHVEFYTGSNSELLSWARRRRTQGYASMTAALGIVIGLLFSFVVFREFAGYVAIVSGMVSVGLYWHGAREFYYCRQVISAWGTLSDERMRENVMTRHIEKVSH